MIRLSEYHKCEDRGCVSIFSFQPFYTKFAIFIHQLKPTLFLIFRHFIKFFNLSDLTELARAQPRHSPPSRFRIEISLCNTWIVLSDWLETSRPISNDFRHHWISTDLKTTNRGPRFDLALTVTWPLLIQSRKSERIS